MIKCYPPPAKACAVFCLLPGSAKSPDFAVACLGLRLLTRLSETRALRSLRTSQLLSWGLRLLTRVSQTPSNPPSAGLRSLETSQSATSLGAKNTYEVSKNLIGVAPFTVRYRPFLHFMHVKLHLVHTFLFNCTIFCNFKK